MRFLLAGAVNTLFGFAVYSAAVTLGASNWLALLIGTLTGSVFNFVTTGGYAFRQLSASRFPKFVLCYFLVYGVNLALLEAFSGFGNRILLQFLFAFPMALLSYGLMSRIVFVQPKAAGPPPD